MENTEQYGPSLYKKNTLKVKKKKKEKKKAEVAFDPDRALYWRYPKPNYRAVVIEHSVKQPQYPRAEKYWKAWYLQVET